MRSKTHRVYTSNGSRREVDHLITYAYQSLPEPGSSPVPQRVEHELPERLYEELSRGQGVEIRYLPEDPTVADFFPGETRHDARFLGWFALGCLAAAAVAGAFAFRSARRTHRLDQVGVRVGGIVEEVRRGKGYVALAVRYTDAGGIQKRATMHFLSGPNPQAAICGATVSLRYDPEDPSNVALA